MIDEHSQGFEAAAFALAVVDHIPAMVAYWDENETCRFANKAYVSWFGKSREELLGTTLRALLGPLYALNEPYIRRAYAGEVQVFERNIPVPGGSGVRSSLATYSPDVRDGKVHGIFVHVADSTLLKDKERSLQLALEERDRVYAKLTTLEGLLSICASCKKIQDADKSDWVQVEDYMAAHTKASFTPGLCPKCVNRLYPEIEND